MIFLIISLIMLAAAIMVSGKGQSRPAAGIRALLVFALAFLSLAFIVADYFTGRGINDAAVFHLLYGVEGAGFGEFMPLILACGFFLVLVLLVSLAAYRYGTGEGSNTGKARRAVAWVLLAGAVLSHPATHSAAGIARSRLLATRWVRHLGALPVPAGLSPQFIYDYEKDPAPPGKAGVTSEAPPARKQQGAALYRRSHDDADYEDFVRYFRQPVISSTGRAPRNLVFIFAESLERTYFDQELFPGLIKGLRQLESAGSSFTNIRDLPGGSWTVAGMTAAMCGVPLVTASSGNAMSGVDTFYSGATCLGDLLHREGYRLEYMGGAKLKFAGKGNLLRSHGFDSVRGRDDLAPLLDKPGYLSGWGLFDDSLLDMAFQRFQELSGQGQPFGLFLLTLDTHHPKGHPSAACREIRYGDGGNSMLNAVACSDHLISRFVDRVLKSPQAKDTIVVIVSDHLAMRNTASDLLRRGERRNLFMIIDPEDAHPTRNAADGSVLDIGPTLLPALGFDGEIGLGRDLLGEEPSLASQLEDMDASLRSWFPYIQEFWEFPKLAEDVEADPEAGTVHVGLTQYSMPVLIRLGEEWEATPLFLDRSVASAMGYFDRFDERTPFLWFDRCDKEVLLLEELGREGSCFLGGRLGGMLAGRELDGKTVIPLATLAGVMQGATGHDPFNRRLGKLTGFFSGPDARRLVAGSPAGSLVYVPRSATDSFAGRYFEINGRLAVNRVPMGREFYFLGSQLDPGQYSSRFTYEKVAGEPPAVFKAIPRELPPGPPNDFEARRVAHGGGSIDGEHYTNSIGALDRNLDRGFAFFELDLSFTSDDELVCIHDWQGSFRRSFGLEPEGAPTLKRFEELVRQKSRFDKCTLGSLAGWMQENPSARLVTDVKAADNLKALAMIKDVIPDAARRVIPQIYDPNNMSAVRELGYRSVIWTLYRYNGDDDMVLGWTDSFSGSFAVTMAKDRAGSGMPGVLRERGIPTYVHTVNDAGEMEWYRSRGVTEIYTDELAPGGPDGS